MHHRARCHRSMSFFDFGVNGTFNAGAQYEFTGKSNSGKSSQITMTVGKNHIAQPESDHMMQKEDNNRAGNEDTKRKIEAKRVWENSCCTMRNTMNAMTDGKFNDKVKRAHDAIPSMGIEEQCEDQLIQSCHNALQSSALQISNYCMRDLTG